MKLKHIKKRKATLQKLNNLTSDENQEVYGVTYTNSFLSQRYLTRSQVMVDKADVHNQQVDMKLMLRVEAEGLDEMESTLHMLTDNKAGDLPGFMVEEESLEIDPYGTVDRPTMQELISVGQGMLTVDMVLNISNPDIYFKEVTIAGSKFTLVEIYQKFDEHFDQTITLLFGGAGNMYFLSHFYNKNLNKRDANNILDMFIDENILGKAIIEARVDTVGGASSVLYPIESVVGSYWAINGDIILNTRTNYLRIPVGKENNYKMTCEPYTKAGNYQIRLEGKHETITIIIE